MRIHRLIFTKNLQKQFIYDGLQYNFENLKMAVY